MFNKNVYPPFCSSKFQKGFTFVELLIVVVTMSLLFGLGYANYRDFSRRQALEAAARSLKGDLRFAQELASSGTKPAGCGTLDGYRFNVNNSPGAGGGQIYTISPVCNGAVLTAVKTVRMSDEIYIDLGADFTNPILFKVLEMGTNIPEITPTTIILAQVGNIKTTFKHQWETLKSDYIVTTITSGGEIYSEGVIDPI